MMMKTTIVVFIPGQKKITDKGKRRESGGRKAMGLKLYIVL
jgi:hypothetical protein